MVHQLSVRIGVVALLGIGILQNRHFLGSILGAFLLLLGLLDPLDIQSINALETSKITKVVASATRLLSWAVENGILVVGMSVAGCQMRALLATHLIFGGVSIHIFAICTLGFCSGSSVVGGTKFTCWIPSFGRLLGNLFMQPGLASKRAEHSHPIGFR